MSLQHQDPAEVEAIAVLIGKAKKKRSLFADARSVVVMACVCTEALMEGILSSVLTPILPSYAKEHGASDLEITVMFALFPLAVLLCSTPMGYIGGKVGRRPFVACGIATTGITSILFGMTSQLPLLFITRFLAGAGSAATWSAIYALLQDVFPYHSTTVIGFTETATGLGGMAGPAIGAILASQMGFSFPFVFIGSLLSTIAIILPCTLSDAFVREKTRTTERRKRRQARRKARLRKSQEIQQKVKQMKSKEKAPAQEGGVRASSRADPAYAQLRDTETHTNANTTANAPKISAPGHRRGSSHALVDDGRPIWRQVMNRTMIVCAANILLSEAAALALTPYYEDHMKDRYNLSPAAIGLVLTAVSASYAVLAPLVGSITRCLTPAKTMFIGMLLSGASFVFVGPIPFIEDLVDKDSSLHLAVLVLSFLVTGVGNALAFIPALPKMLESVQHLGGRVTGAVSGSFYALFSIGQTFGPFIGTLLVKFVGFQWAGAILGFGLCAFAPLLLSAKGAAVVDNADSDSSDDEAEGVLVDLPGQQTDANKKARKNTHEHEHDAHDTDTDPRAITGMHSIHDIPLAISPKVIPARSLEDDTQTSFSLPEHVFSAPGKAHDGYVLLAGDRQEKLPIPSDTTDAEQTQTAAADGDREGKQSPHITFATSPATPPLGPLAHTPQSPGLVPRTASGSRTISSPAIGAREREAKKVKIRAALTAEQQQKLDRKKRTESRQVTGAAMFVSVPRPLSHYMEEDYFAHPEEYEESESEYSESEDMDEESRRDSSDAVSPPASRMGHHGGWDDFDDALDAAAKGIPRKD